MELTVTDTLGATGTTTIQVAPGHQMPQAIIDSPALGTTWSVGDTIAFSGHAIGSQGNPLPPSAMTWTLRQMHCSSPTSCHAHPVDIPLPPDGGTFVPPYHEYPSYLELELSVTDGPLTQKVVRHLHPQTVEVTVTTNPPGLTATLGAHTGPAPFTLTVIEGARIQIGAATPQDLGSMRNVWQSWSDGGGILHLVTVEETSTFTATFESTVIGCRHTKHEVLPMVPPRCTPIR